MLNLLLVRIGSRETSESCFIVKLAKYLLDSLYCLKVSHILFLILTTFGEEY